MKNLNDKSIETAFTEIRCRFENRNNEFGLEILDSYEDRWIATGNLSDKQIAWLEKQLDDSWREPKIVVVPCPDDNQPVQQISNTLPKLEGVEELIDAMVRDKLNGDGKVLIDLAQLNSLVRAIDNIRDMLKSF